MSKKSINTATMGSSLDQQLTRSRPTSNVFKFNQLTCGILAASALLLATPAWADGDEELTPITDATSTLDTGEISITSGKSQEISGSTNFTLGKKLTGVGGVTKKGASVVTLNVANDYTGDTNIEEGTLKAGIANAFSSASNVNISAAGILDLNNHNQSIKALTGVPASKVILGTANLTTTFDSAGGEAIFGGIISGDGGLIKAGTGTLTLSGANIYTGATNIQAGTLQVSGAALKSAVEIASGAHFIFNNSGDQEYNKTISGDGAVEKKGVGDLILSGTNSYTGSTTVKSGILQLNSSIAGTAVIDEDATLTFNNSDSWTQKAISGTGKLIKKGTGELTLNEANTGFTGATTIEAGTLKFAKAAALSGSKSINLTGGTLELTGTDDITLKELTSAEGSIINIGSINLTAYYTEGTILNPTNSPTIAGTITGTGKLIKEGNAKLIFSGKNTGGFTGATEIKAGTLQLESDLNSTLNIGNSAHLVFKNTESLEYTKAISGDGDLTKEGSGKLTLSADNTYTGSTIVNNGTLQLSHATKGKAVINETGTLALNITAAGTQSNLSGVGNLVKQGTGTLTVSGTNSDFTGATTIKEGALTFAKAAALSASKSIHLTGGKLELLSGGDISLNKLTSDTGSTINLGTTNLTASYAEGESTIAGNITGSGNFIKDGAGKLIFSGTNETFSGTTSIQAGTLQLSSDLNSALTIDNGAHLIFNNTEALAYSKAISGAGDLTKEGSGQLTLGAANSYAGKTLIKAGTLKTGIVGALPEVSVVEIASGATLDLNNTTQSISALTGAEGSKVILGSGTLKTNFNAETVTFAGVISGDGGLTKEGSGTLLLTGDNIYEGATSVNTGALQIEGKLSGPVKVESTAKLIFNNANDLTYDSVISGAGNVIKSGAGKLTLSENNAYMGTTNITAGTLQLNKGFSSSAVTIGENSKLVFNNSSPISYAANKITGSGDFQQTGSGILTFTGTASEFTGISTIGGGTAASTLKFAAENLLPESVLNILAQGTVDADSKAQKFAGLQGAGTLNMQAGALTLNTAKSFTFDGNITGSGTVTKTGAGTQILNGINNSAGAITVNSGTLLIGSDTAHKTAKFTASPTGSKITVASGATLGGFGTIVAPVMVEEGAILFAGTDTDIGTLTIHDADITFKEGSTLNYNIADNDDAGNADLIKVTGSGIVHIEAGSKLSIKPVSDAKFTTGHSYTVISSDNSIDKQGTGFTAQFAKTMPFLEIDKVAYSTDPNKVTLTVRLKSSDPAPDTEVPDTEVPDTEVPGTEAPDTGSSETEAPGTGSSDTEAPGTGSSETEAPDTGSSDTEAPGTGSSDTEAPGTGSSDTEAPGTGSSDTEAPGTGSSETEAPGTETPDTETPGTGSPDTGAIETVNNGTVDIASTDTITSSRNYTAPLDKKGTGTLVINANVNATQGTSVTAGILQIGDKKHGAVVLTSDVEVQDGGTLQGYGKVAGSVHVKAGGILSPGGSIGPLTIGEDLTLAANSKLIYDIASDGTSDKLDITGTVTIDGAHLKIVPETPDAAGWKQNHSYKVLSAGKVVLTNAFNVDASEVDNQLPFLKVDPLKYTDKDVTLSLSLKTDPDTNSQENRQKLFMSFASNANQRSVAKALATLPADNKLFVAVTNAQSKQQVPTIYNNLTPEIYASASDSLLQNSHYVRDAVLQSHQAENPVWISAWGHSGRSQGDSQHSDSKIRNQGWGVALGGDLPLTQHISGGLMAGYEHTSINDRNDSDAKARVNSLHLGTYLRADVNSIRVNGGIIYSLLDQNTERKIRLSSVEGKAQSDHKGHQVQLFAELNRDFHLATSTTLTPYVSVAQVWQNMKAASENSLGNAAPAALQLASHSKNATFTGLGVRGVITLPTALPASLQFAAGWQHAFTDKDNAISSRFTGSDTRISTHGTGIAKDSALISSGLSIKTSESSSLSISYQGEFAADHKDHSGKLQWQMRF